MAGWVAGAVAVGSIYSANKASKAASSAAATQAEAAREAGESSLEGLKLQLAADKEALDRTLAAQQAAAAAGDAAAAAALDKQLALQRELYNKQVENLAPFTKAGELGQNRLLDLLGLSGNTSAQGYGSGATNFSIADMEQDPGYQFRVSEGQKAIDRSTAARSGTQSGAALKAAARYGQDMGSQEYGNAFNRFMAQRESQLGNLRSLQSVGQASAAGQANAAGSLSQAGSQAYGNYGATGSNIAAQTGAGATAAYAGSNAARQSAYGTNAANQIGAITGAANANAAGQTGSANAWTQGINSMIGAGLSGYNAYNSNQLMQQIIAQNKGSDVAIKENIRQVGVLGNGLNVYEYEYKPAYKDAWGHGRQVGVMAQEVEQIIPEAVSVHPDGYKMVNYSMIH